MKKLLALIPFLLLVGCGTPIPIKQSFPEVPKELQEACPDLKTVNPKTDKLSDIVTVVSDNYAQYYDCKAKVDDWIEWYKTQQTIYDKR